MAPQAPAALVQLTDLTHRLHQAENFEPLVAALQQGQSATVDGAWGSSAGLVAAALALQAPAPVLVVLAHPRDLDAWAGDLLSFSGLRPSIFPAWDNRPTGSIDEVAGQRLRLLTLLQGDKPPRILLTTIQALIQPVPERSRFLSQQRLLRSGETAPPDELAGWLVEHGYQHREVVELPGEFSRRGGIVDVYSPDAETPHRLEFFGDDIDSMRAFNPHTQRSLGQVETLQLTGLRSSQDASGSPSGHLCDYLPAGSWTILVESEELHEQGKHYLERVPSVLGLFSLKGALQQLLRFPSVKIETLPSPTVEASYHLHVESVERISGDVGRVRDELDAVAGREQVMIACQNEAECKRLGEVLAAGQLAQNDRLHLVTGRVRAGFRWLDETDGGVIVLGGQELFHRETRPESGPRMPRRRLESRAIDSFLDLAEGDLVVHVSYGIGRFRGMQLLNREVRNPGSDNGARTKGAPTQAEEHLTLEFRDGVKIYVPASKIDLVQKYVGGGKTDPELSKLGGTSWGHRKDRVEEAVLDLASEMIELHALREAKPGVAFPPDTDWQREFEAAFPYQETPDQLTTLAEIKPTCNAPGRWIG